MKINANGRRGHGRHAKGDRAAPRYARQLVVPLDQAQVMITRGIDIHAVDRSRPTTATVVRPSPTPHPPPPAESRQHALMLGCPPTSVAERKNQHSSDEKIHAPNVEGIALPYSSTTRRLSSLPTPALPCSLVVANRILSSFV